MEDRKRQDAQGEFAAGENPKSTVQSPQSKTANDLGLGTQDSGLETKSRFTKAQERLEKTWESVNKRKSDLDAKAASLEQQRLTFERDKAQLEAVRRQAEQPQATPEQALQAAQLRRRDADALRMQASRATEAGRFDEAQRLNKQADKAESLADELGAYAEELRKNPPVSMHQRQQQFEQARKHWTVEACNAYPDLGKNGSRLQQVVAQHLNSLAKQDPQLLVHPSLIYHVARLADAQIKVTDLEAVAARVPVLQKETESLRARIKELEAETTPAVNGSVNRLNNESKEDYGSLRQQAADIGHGRW
jgi:chromosome segregation ATPase